MSEAELALGKAMAEKGELTLEHVERIAKEKEQIIRKTGILTLETPGPRDEVGGLEQLWDWLEKTRKTSLAKTPYAMDWHRHPRGSPDRCASLRQDAQCASDGQFFGEFRSCVSTWGQSLYGKYVGESEKNVRKAMDCGRGRWRRPESSDRGRN